MTSPEKEATRIRLIKSVVLSSSLSIRLIKSVLSPTFGFKDYTKYHRLDGSLNFDSDKALKVFKKKKYRF